MSKGSNKPRVLVVVQLTGGTDFMNTLVPYNNSIYYDNRPKVSIPQDKVIPLNDELAWHPEMRAFKNLFDRGDVAVIQGIGYPDSSRSHFRAMDVWHTCEPHEISTKGWLGESIQELDQNGENPLTGVNFGRGLPRAMVKTGVPVTSVGDLDSYGLMTNIERQRDQTLEFFKDMYSQAIGTGPVMDYLSQTATDVMKGADVIKQAPEMYESKVEYGDDPIGKSLRDVARVHLADLGTRIFYTQHGGYDHHANENPSLPKLLGQMSRAVSDFQQDLRDHNEGDNVMMLIFTEFGRRIKDNGSGTDHGSGGGAYLVGNSVNGGFYGEYPSINPSDWLNGEDMKHNVDFRGVYSTVLDQWMGLDPVNIVHGNFEQLDPFIK